MNIPWNRDIMGDAEYKAAFDRIVQPIVAQFKPDLALVACGFDAAAADMVGEYIVTPQMYGYMTRRLKELVPGERVVLCLEGGYNPKAIGQCFEACIAALLSKEEMPVSFPRGDQLAICKRATQTLQNVVKTQQQFWNLQRTDTGLNSSENQNV